MYCVVELLCEMWHGVRAGYASGGDSYQRGDGFGGEMVVDGGDVGAYGG